MVVLILMPAFLECWFFVTRHTVSWCRFQSGDYAYPASAALLARALNPLEHVLKGLESNQGVMRSITGWSWIINAVAELNCNKTAPLHIHIHRLLLLPIKTIQFIPDDLLGFLKSNVSTAYKTQNPAHTIFLNY